LIPAGSTAAGFVEGKGRSQVTGPFAFVFLSRFFSRFLGRFLDGFLGRVISVERQRVALVQRLLLGRNSS
jgi:hypothetical protein